MARRNAIVSAALILLIVAIVVVAPRFSGRKEMTNPSAENGMTTNSGSNPSTLYPESQHVVELSNTGFVYRHPDGSSKTIPWDDLTRVEIVTTDKGPIEPDVFWVIQAGGIECVIPQGATGEKELADRLRALPGFRYREAIKAMSSAENQRFLVWEKPREGK